jgi:diaminopimelate epimerase
MAKEKMKIVSADPAGNITLFVLNAEEWTQTEREAIAVQLLAQKELKAEQIGFVKKPECSKNNGGGPWRLDMAGGEFCGNAARAFGFYAACVEGADGKGSITIEISGAPRPLTVNYEIAERSAPQGEARGYASVTMPLPIGRKLIRYRGADRALYLFDGIHHVIMEDTPRKEEAFAALKTLAEEKAGEASAFGVLFYNEKTALLTPLVSVRALNSLYYETSCGSGSAAFACEHFLGVEDGENSVMVHQPGGIIEVTVSKRGGKVDTLSIGGSVVVHPAPVP